MSDAAPGDGARNREPEADAVAPGDAAADESPEMAALRAAVAQANDRALRASAEIDNIRRRSAREVENAQRFALEKFVAALLPVTDSLEQALASVRARPGEEGAGLGEGVELALRLLLGTLEKFGVSPVDPVGAPFDPQFHEAMSAIVNADMEPGSVMAVMQKGYVLNGRLVRPARVLVARAPEGTARPPGGIDERA